MTVTAAKTTSDDSFRQNLRRRIDQLGLSDAEVARRAGMTPQTFWRYINGVRNPAVGSPLDRIADAVDLPVHEFFLPPE